MTCLAVVLIRFCHITCGKKCRLSNQNLFQEENDRCVFKLRCCSIMDKTNLMRFQSDTSVFKFLQRSVDEKHLMRFQSETYVFKVFQTSMQYRPLVTNDPSMAHLHFQDVQNFNPKRISFFFFFLRHRSIDLDDSF